MTDQSQRVSLNLDFPLADGRELVQGPLTYNTDGLATKHNADFIKDAKFAEAYRLGAQTLGGDLHIEWRVHVCCWAAHQVKRLEGDFVECGVNTGILSRAVTHYIDFATLSDKTFYLLDTFQGIPLEQLSEAEKQIGLQAYNQGYAECFDQVKATFADIPNVRIIKGRVPDTLAQVDTDKVCYLSIDMNCVAPEIAAAEFFWDKLVSGGIVILDDYAWAAHINQKHAFDAFASERQIKILSLPTGQGLIVKV